MSDHHPDPPSHRGAIALALFVTLLWSSSWVLVRSGLDDEALQPLTFAALRYGLAAAVLVGWVTSRNRHRSGIASLGRPLLVRVVVLGIVFYAVTQGAQFVAIDNQPAATTSLVLSLTPLVVAALAGRSLGELATPRQIAGAVLVAAGAWLYFAGNLGATAAGMIAAVVALGANASAALLGRRVNRPSDVAPIVVTALSMAVGAVILVGAGLAVEGIPTVSARAWLIIVWLAVVNTALAFTLWNRSLRRLSALESAAINNTMLIQIAVLGWIFLDERPGVVAAIGIVVVTLGILLAQSVSLPTRRRGASPPAE